MEYLQKETADAFKLFNVWGINSILCLEFKKEQKITRVVFDDKIENKTKECIDIGWLPNEFVRFKRSGGVVYESRVDYNMLELKFKRKRKKTTFQNFLDFELSKWI